MRFRRKSESSGSTRAPAPRPIAAPRPIGLADLGGGPFFENARVRLPCIAVLAACGPGTRARLSHTRPVAHLEVPRYSSGVRRAIWACSCTRRRARWIYMVHLSCFEASPNACASTRPAIAYASLLLQPSNAYNDFKSISKSMAPCAGPGRTSHQVYRILCT